MGLFKRKKTKKEKINESERLEQRNKRRKPKPTTRHITQSLLGIEDVIDGVVVTKDKRYVKIVEVLPVNFFNKDALEQSRIVFNFAEYLKIAPETFQIKTMAVPLDINDYMEKLKEYRHSQYITPEKDRMLDELSDMVSREVLETKLTTNRFFIIIEYEDFEFSPDIENVIKVLNERERVLRSYLNQCGCIVVNNHLTQGKYNNYALYEYIILHFNRHNPEFEDYAQQVFNEVTDKNPNKSQSITINDYLAPREVAFYDKNFCEINGIYTSYHYIREYRNTVYAGWLNPLLASSLPVDVDIHFTKIDKREAKKSVRKSITRQETITGQLKENTAMAQESQAIWQDAMRLRERMYGSDEQMYDMSIIITVRGSSMAELNDIKDEVYSLMESKDLTLSPLEYRQEAGFTATLPLKKVSKKMAKMMNRNIMGGDLASIFPFSDPGIFEPGGLYIGKNRGGRPCAFDNFDTSQYDSPHILLTGSTGTGKTYAAQAMMARFFTKGARCFAITPIKGYEYERLCNYVNGEFIKFSANGNNHVNIFDIRIPVKPLDETENVSHLAEKLGAVMTFFSLLLPRMTELQESLISVAVVQAYQAKGITYDNESLKNTDGTYKEVPIIEDVAKALKRMLTDKEMFDEATMPNPLEYKAEINTLLAILQQFISGSYSFLNKHTNIRDIDNDYIIFDITDLDSAGAKIVGAVMYTITNHIMNIMVEDITREKVVFIDEVWKLIGEGSEESASFIKHLYKIIRAYNGCVATASQDIEDWKSKEGETVLNTIINNSTFKLLFGMKPNSLTTVREMLALSPEDVNRIQMFNRGDCLLVCGNNTFEVRFDTTETEHMAITTDPRERKYLDMIESQSYQEKQEKSDVKTFTVAD